MRRIFFYSSSGVKVFIWHKKNLVGSVQFDNDENSKQQFEEYLKTSTPMDSQLLVDVIDEDFRRESIPHVNSRDRKALLQRMVDKHFRDEKYYQVKMLGRSQEGRRDDKILLSSLSNVEKINQWTYLIERNHVAIAGIWSVPHITIELMKTLKIHGDNVLFVTRELPWSQRETFFQKGKLIFSRLERLDTDLSLNTDAAVSWKCLTDGAEQIKHFLTNQRIIGFTDTLSVNCLVNSQVFKEKQKENHNTPQIEYHLIDEASVFKGFTATQEEPLKTDAAYTWICSQKSPFVDHYGTKEIKYNFIRAYVDNSFKSVSSFAALFLLTAAVIFWINALKTHQDIQRTEKNIYSLQQRYAKNFGAIPNKLADANLVHNSVQHSQLLNMESSETPQKYFKNLSSVYSNPRFRALELDDIHWIKHPRETIQQVVNQLANIQIDPYAEQHYPEEETYGEEPQINTKYQALLKVSGKLNRDNLNYRSTVSVMSEFMESLKSLAIVSDIHLIKTPVDIRPKSSFSDKSGSDEENLIKNTEADRYEILIVVEPQQESKQ